MEFKKATQQKNREMRAVYAKTLAELMEHDKNIIAMDADLVSACGAAKLFAAFPEQTINMGISEANMMGAASGMSLLGKIPFVHTFAPFATRRAYDQVYLSGGYQQANIRIYGSDPGFWASHNGGTHTSVEDIALMNVIPNMTVIAPADATAMEWTIRNTAKMKGVFYIRSGRKVLPDIYDDSMTFELGKGITLKEGKDGVIFAIGVMVQQALDAAKNLQEKHQLDVAVVDMFTIKPLDVELIKKITKNKKVVVTAENHSIIGGLGSAVADVLAQEGSGIPLRKVGIKNRFGEVGTAEYLQEKYGLLAVNIEEAVLSVIKD